MKNTSLDVMKLLYNDTRYFCAKCGDYFKTEEQRNKHAYDTHLATGVKK